MKIRPTSITVISWILIVMGAISTVTSTLMINNPIARDVMAKSPIPLPIQFAMMYVGLVIMIVSGIGMLKGRNWARLLYVGWNVLSFIIGFATSPMKTAMIPGLFLFMVVLFFLFRPAAREFFSSLKSEHAQNT